MLCPVICLIYQFFTSKFDFKPLTLFDSSVSASIVGSWFDPYRRRKRVYVFHLCMLSPIRIRDSLVIPYYHINLLGRSIFIDSKLSLKISFNASQISLCNKKLFSWEKRNTNQMHQNQYDLHCIIPIFRFWFIECATILKHKLQIFLKVSNHSVIFYSLFLDRLQIHGRIHDF